MSVSYFILLFFRFFIILVSGSVVNVIVSVVNLICAYDETYFNCTSETHRNKSFSNISFF